MLAAVMIAGALIFHVMQELGPRRVAVWLTRAGMIAFGALLLLEEPIFCLLYVIGLAALWAVFGIARQRAHHH